MNTIIYKSHFELLQSLTNEQAGILIKAIGEYCNGIYPEINDLLVKGIFISIKRDFDLQAENYQKKVKRNQENGKKGGRPKDDSITKTLSGLEIPKEIDKHFVYLMYDTNKNEYKIGETKNLIQRRYDIKRPTGHLEVIHYEIYDAYTCQQLEKQILNEYKQYSIGGDWFKLDENQVIEIVSKLSKKTQLVSNYPNLSQPIPNNLKDKDKDKDKDIEKDIDNASSIATCSDASLINKIKRQEDLSEVLDNIFGDVK